ncbi:GNAT family N-acetyltransferase [Glutamicibacter mishrai]|uniref:GNAT family N-acetyltransferase n=1 Tax=Glutamicibacter mishrai TaxID=1775880 RepID=UPI0032EC76A6
MKELHTQRLILRAWEPEDAVFLLDLESRSETVQYLGPDPMPMTTFEQAAASIVRRRAVREDGQGIWAITLRNGGELVGNLLCKPMSEQMQRLIGMGLADQPREIGWHLHPDAKGQGYATEAARAVLDYANQRNVTTEILAIVDPRNTPSLQLCERLGMQRIGSTTGYVSPEHVVFLVPSANDDWQRVRDDGR